MFDSVFTRLVNLILVCTILSKVMLNRLFLQIGFAQAVRASGFIVLGLLLIANLIMRTRYPPKIAGPKRKAPSPKSLLSEPRYTLATIGTTLYCLGVFYPINFIQASLVTGQVGTAASDSQHLHLPSSRLCAQTRFLLKQRAFHWRFRTMSWQY